MVEVVAGSREIGLQRTDRQTNKEQPLIKPLYICSTAMENRLWFINKTDDNQYLANRYFFEAAIKEDDIEKD